MERAAREADYLRHASDELKALAPKDGEETTLAGRRTAMMQGEKIAADLREAQDAVSGNHSPVAALSAAVRRLERRAGNSPTLVEPAVKAIDIAINALEEADQHLSAALAAADFDPAELERIEERLFALRAASRKYSTPVDELAALAAKYAADVALIDAGADQLKKLEEAAVATDKQERSSGYVGDGGRTSIAYFDRQTPEANLIFLCDRATLENAMQQLPAPLLEVVLLCDVEEMKYREIANVLDIPIGTVMSRIARARAAMRRTLESYAAYPTYPRPSPESRA